MNTEKTNDIKIVDLAPEMWETYKEIRLKGLKEDPQAFGSLYIDELKFPEQKWKERANNRLFTLAIKNGHPIGTMGAVLSDENERTVAKICGVYVASESRRQKIRSRLIQRILEKIDQTSGVNIVRLDVNKNQIAAIRLYQKFGFVKVGEKLEKRDNGEECIELIMERQ